MKLIAFLALSLIFTAGYSQKGIENSVQNPPYSYQYALIEASRQKMIRNIDEAISLYKTCVNSNPKCDVAYYELGTVYSAIGENQKAEENLEKAYKINQDNYWYAIAYSELLKINGNTAGSLKILKKLRKINVNSALTIDFKISEIYSQNGKYRKALNLLEKIERENGVSEIISFKKIEIFKLQENFSGAEKVLSELISEAPEIVEYQIIKAEFYSETGDTLSAIRAYENAFIIDSSNIFAITNLADLYSALGDKAKAYYYLNQAFLNNNIPVGNKIQTMMLLNEDRELIRSNKEIIGEMVENLLFQYPENNDIKTVAYDFYNGLDNHKKALSIIKEILTVRKDDYIIWQQALYNASMLENFEEMVLIGEEALKYFPNKNELYLFVGMAYFQKEEYLKAYTILEGAYSNIRESDKVRVQFLLFISEASYKAGFKLNAYNYFEELVIEDPENYLVKNNYSYYLALDSVRLERAKELSYSTIVNAPENSTFLDTYAWVLFKMGDYGHAKDYAEKALVINEEKDPDIIFHYAEILYAQGKILESLKYYKLALERGYDSEIIENRVNRVP